MDLRELVFVAFGKNVVALDRATGRQIWYCKIPKGQTYPAMLLDGEQLFISAMGYTYCLDPYTGRVMWENELPGLGTGVAAIATVNASTDGRRSASAAISDEQAAANQHTHTHHTS